MASWVNIAQGGPPDHLLPRAHAHNDYHHPRPLLDALDHGFCSVEADIFLIDGELLVGHAPSELTPERTLGQLYLKPLWQRVQANGGQVFETAAPFTLLIDIKRNGAQVYPVLQTQLQAYREMVSGLEHGKWISRAVQVVVSGDRPLALIRDDPARLVGIDGRPPDLASTEPDHLIPMISDRWSNQFRWRGQGPFPLEERSRLDEIVAQAHRAGRRVRFWATPESPSVWKALVEAQVDHINTDELSGLRDFLLTETSKNTRSKRSNVNTD